MRHDYDYDTRDVTTEPDSWKALPTKWKVAAIATAAAVIITLFLAFCYRQVDAGAVGIITRGGDVNRTASPGPVLKLPWPIERFHEMDVRVQSEEQKASAASEDLQDVSATLVLNYHLNAEEALDVFSEIGTEYKDRVISPALQEVFKAASAEFTAEELITQRAAVKANAAAQLRERLADYGVIVDDLSLTNFAFSKEFTASVEARQVAEQEALRAQATAARAKAEAQGRLDSALLDAQAQEALQQTLTDELLRKWAIEKWDGHMPQFVSGDGGTLFQIPVNPQQTQ